MAEHIQKGKSNMLLGLVELVSPTRHCVGNLFALCFIELTTCHIGRGTGRRRSFNKHRSIFTRQQSDGLAFPRAECNPLIELPRKQISFVYADLSAHAGRLCWSDLKQDLQQMPTGFYLWQASLLCLTPRALLLFWCGVQPSCLPHPKREVVKQISERNWLGCSRTPAPVRGSTAIRCRSCGHCQQLA